MRISDWSSDVCSSDLHGFDAGNLDLGAGFQRLGIRKLLVHDDVFIQAHPERAVAEGVTISEGAGDARPVEVFQEVEAHATLTAIGDLPLRIVMTKCIVYGVGESPNMSLYNQAET